MRPSKKTVLTISLALLLGVASALMLNYTNRTIEMPSASIFISLNERVSIRKTFDIYLRLTVVRNGQIIDVWEDYKDPILKNFYAIVYNYFLGGRAAGYLMQYKDVSGASQTYVDTEYGTAGYRSYIGMAIGNGTTPVSPTDYKLASWYKSALGVDEVLSENGTHIWVNYTAQFYIDTNVNISEAGLFLYHVDTNMYSGVSLTSVYITRDLISPPVQLQPDDYLVVTYIVYMKKSGNFVKNFYIFLLNYMFRNETYSMLSYNDTSGNSHTYVDTEYGGYNPRANIQLGNGTVSFDFTAHNLSSPIAMESANVRYEDHTPDNITVCISALFSFSQDYNISEVGLILGVDADSSSSQSLVDVLILYMLPASPISVTAGQQLIFKITITLTY